MSPAPFGRVITAMVTPFAADGSVDLELAARLAVHLVDHGSDGLVLCGTTGESPTLSWEEQHQLFSAVKGAVGARASLLAGTGSNCTAEAVEAIGEAAALGADGALVVVPYYNKPPQEGLHHRLDLIAGHVAGHAHHPHGTDRQHRQGERLAIYSGDDALTLPMLAALKLTTFGRSISRAVVSGLRLQPVRPGML